jgi:membrane fusion protein, multidrug efflux system
LSDQTTPTSHLLTRDRIIWGAAILAIVLVLVLLIRHRSDAKPVAPPKPKVPITTAAAQKGSIGEYLSAIGTVTPVYTASITSQVTGIITAVRFTEGQTVKKGDPLIEIDSRPYEAQLLQAQGTLERDLNVLGQAQMDYERYREAWQKNSIAKQQLDDQEKIVLQDKGTVRNDSGVVKFDQVQVDFCHIKAPIDGRVGLRLVDPGNVVTAATATTLAVVTQLDPITVIFTVPQDNLGEIQDRLRAHATLTIDALDRTGASTLANGKMLTLDNQINTTTGTVQGRALFKNDSGSLFPNQFVNTRLLVNTLQGVTLIPSSAIQQNGQASFVYVIQNNVAHMRSIKPGVTNAGITQVDGINPGDVVANSSFDKLQDNIAVVVSSSPPAAGSAASTGANTNGSSAP